MEPELDAAAGLGRWTLGDAVVSFWSLSVKEVPLGNHSAQSPASVFVVSPGHVMLHCKVIIFTSAVCNRCCGAYTGCCGRAGQVVCGGCGFAAFWFCSVEEVPLGNHRAQSPASVRVASPGHVVGTCKVKYNL